MLRPGLSLTTDRRGDPLLLDPRSGAHPVPEALLEDLRAALSGGGAAGAAARWLEARGLLASERAARVDAWAAARRAPVERFLPGSRFTCHGCGKCCETYLPAPVSDQERARILAGRAALAPHVAAPEAEWFAPYPDEDAWSLGRTAQGACVFLGADRLCTVHKVLGAAAKPHVCRSFPLAVARRPDGDSVSLRVECETFARSRDDGAPLDAAWADAVVRGERAPLVVRAVVRLHGPVLVPYELARALERRVIAVVAGGGWKEVRDLTWAVLEELPLVPDAPDLDRAERLIDATPAEWTARRGAVDPERGRRALASLLARAADEHERLIAARRESLYPEHARANDALVRDALAADPGADGLDDPGVLDFVRACSVQLAASGRPLANPVGVFAGYALLAFEHEVARRGAGLLARRRGAAVAGRDDWNRALACVDRALGTAAGLEELVVAFFADWCPSPRPSPSPPQGGGPG